MGLVKPTTLEEVYKAFDQQGFEPIDPLIAINTRFIYDEQSREWLRIAVPFDSMIDSDGFHIYQNLVKV